MSIFNRLPLGAHFLCGTSDICVCHILLNLLFPQSVTLIMDVFHSEIAPGNLFTKLFMNSFRDSSIDSFLNSLRDFSINLHESLLKFFHDFFSSRDFCRNSQRDFFQEYLQEFKVRFFRNIFQRLLQKLIWMFLVRFFWES